MNSHNVVATAPGEQQQGTSEAADRDRSRSRSRGSGSRGDRSRRSERDSRRRGGGASRSRSRSHERRSSRRSRSRSRSYDRRRSRSPRSRSFSRSHSHDRSRVSCLSGVVIAYKLLYILNVLFCAVTYYTISSHNHIMISFVQIYLPIQKCNREIEIDATVVIANIVIGTDMVGLRGMVVAVGLLRGDTTMTGMVLHHPDSTVVVHHLWWWLSWG
jgi:hypothetical protein